MSSWYVYSAAAGAGTGADWTNAFTTLAAAITAAAAGDTYYVANDHAETQGSALTLTLKGTNTAPDRILCVSRAGSVPPVAADLTTGGSITTTGAFALTLQSGQAYVYGITFNCGTGASTASLSLNSTGALAVLYEACALNLVNTASASAITLTGNVDLKNCTTSFGAVGQGFAPAAGVFSIRNTSAGTFVTGATIPTALVRSLGSNVPTLRLDGLDLSALAAGKSIFAGITVTARAQIINCKLDGSVTVSSAPTGPTGMVDLIGCHSTTNAARNERFMYQGTLTTETTIIRTSGATNGTTAYSWKVVTTANTKRDFPFETLEGVIWNSTTGSPKTLTIGVVTDNVTLTDAEAWVEVEYLGSAATPLASLVTDANATILTTAANQTTSASTWTTTGLTTPVKQDLAVTFTPNMVGPIRWKVKVAKVSTTLYVDPKPVIS